MIFVTFPGHFILEILKPLAARVLAGLPEKLYLHDPLVRRQVFFFIQRVGLPSNPNPPIAQHLCCLQLQCESLVDRLDSCRLSETLVVFVLFGFACTQSQSCGQPLILVNPAIKGFPSHRSVFSYL